MKMTHDDRAATLRCDSELPIVRATIAAAGGRVIRLPDVSTRRDRPRAAQAARDWVALMRRVGAGDHDAVAELYDATSHLVFGLALRILGERGLAEDAVAEVYAQVWRQATGFDPSRGSAVSWLLTLTRSRAIDLVRARGRERATEPLEAAAEVLSPTPDPETTTVTAERHRLVRAALASLSAEQRELIELAYFSGLSHSEIAARLEQPLGTVKTRIRAGMTRLRDLLSPTGALGSGAVTESGIR